MNTVAELDSVWVCTCGSVNFIGKPCTGERH